VTSFVSVKLIIGRVRGQSCSTVFEDLVQPPLALPVWARHRSEIHIELFVTTLSEPEPRAWVSLNAAGTVYSCPVWPREMELLNVLSARTVLYLLGGRTNSTKGE
jgi:hypothetical protein